MTPDIPPTLGYDGAWEAICDLLAHQGVEVVFGLPGDDLRLLTAAESRGLRVVLCREQRTAVFAATGQAMASGRLAVCAVGKGPALTNALTGLLEASASAAPVLLLAGGTGADRRGSGAFQELDQMALVTPLVRWAGRLDAVERVVATAERAVLAAVGGPPGPTYLEVPDPLAEAAVPPTRPWSPRFRPARPRPAAEDVVRSLELLTAARRPVVLGGGGLLRSCRTSGHGAAEQLADRLGAALAVTASGRGSIDEDHPRFCGLAGLYAPPGVEPVWREADLVIALGSRLEETATDGWALPPEVPVLQVTLDNREASTERPTQVLLGDATSTASAWVEALQDDHPRAGRDLWAARVAGCRADALALAEARDAPVAGGPPRVAEVLRALDEVCPEPMVLVQENGLSDMWSYWYPHWSCRTPGGSVVPSEQTSLGFGAAAALGVALARPGSTVVALVGDGAFDTLAGDLATMTENGVGIVYLVLCNGGYGWLQARWDRVGDGTPRFARPGRIARPLPDGVPVSRVQEATGLRPALRAALDSAAGGRVAVVDVVTALSDRAPGADRMLGDLPIGSVPPPVRLTVTR